MDQELSNPSIQKAALEVFLRLLVIKQKHSVFDHSGNVNIGMAFLIEGVAVVTGAGKAFPLSFTQRGRVLTYPRSWNWQRMLPCVRSGRGTGCGPSRQRL